MTFASATIFGAPVASTVVTFDASGHATHPFAKDSSGNPRIVDGTPGDSLVVLTLPFGSFTAAQTPADITVNLNLSPLADYDPAHVADQLTISAQGGFALGRDPLANPTVDPPVLQPVPTTLTFSPSIVTLTKVSDALEGETATGPNFVHSYTIDLDVATGQTLNGVHLQDLLPANIVYLGSSVAVGSGTLVSEPVTGSVVNPAANLLDYDFGNITGVDGVDARVTVRFHVADTSGAGAPVIDHASGTATQTTNDVRATGTFVPLDARDPTTPFVDDITPIDNILINRSLALQKSGAIAVDNNVAGLSPDDVIAYTLNLQLSDYFTAGDIKLTDVLADGQRIDTSFKPVFTVVERGISTGEQAFAATIASGGELTGGNFVTAYDPTTGRTTASIDLSNEIAARNLFGDGDGVLAGGRTRADDSLAMTAATTIAVSFRAVVQTRFAVPRAATRTSTRATRLGTRPASRRRSATTTRSPPPAR